MRVFGYSRRLVEHLDVGRHNSVVRASMLHYNTIDEIDRLIEALETIIRR